MAQTRWPGQAAMAQPAPMLGQTRTVAVPATVGSVRAMPMTYAAAPPAPMIGSGQPFEFTPLPIGLDNGPTGNARLRDGNAMPGGGPCNNEFPPEPQGGAPPGTEMRLPDGEPRRRTRGLDRDPVPSPQGIPASYQSTSYGQSSYGPTSQGSAVGGGSSEEMLREVLANQRRMQEELQYFQSRMDSLEQRVPGGRPDEFCPGPQGPGRGPPPQMGNGYDQGPPHGGPPYGGPNNGGPGPQQQQQRSFERPPPGFDNQGGGGGPPYGGPNEQNRGAPPGQPQHQRGAAANRPQRSIGICC